MVQDNTSPLTGKQRKTHEVTVSEKNVSEKSLMAGYQNLTRTHELGQIKRKVN